MSAIRVRSSRLRSLALVAGAFQSPGRSAASFSSSARPGSGGSMSWAASSACSASARAASLASHRASRAAGDQPVLRLDLAERALGPVGLIAGPLNGQLSCPADPLVPARDLIGG